jgi:hypothetical protein
VANLSDDDIDEGDSTTLSGSFVDPGTLDHPHGRHQLGDGSTTRSSTWRGRPVIRTSHTYLDDDADDSYTITVTVTDDDTGSTSTTTDITVSNVALALGCRRHERLDQRER